MFCPSSKTNLRKEKLSKRKFWNIIFVAYANCSIYTHLDFDVSSSIFLHCTESSSIKLQPYSLVLKFRSDIVFRHENKLHHNQFKQNDLLPSSMSFNSKCLVLYLFVSIRVLMIEFSKTVQVDGKHCSAILTQLYSKFLNFYGCAKIRKSFATCAV